jgi:hypothetical protein
MNTDDSYQQARWQQRSCHRRHSRTASFLLAYARILALVPHTSTIAMLGFTYFAIWKKLLLEVAMADTKIHSTPNYA